MYMQKAAYMKLRNYITHRWALCFYLLAGLFILRIFYPAL